MGEYFTERLPNGNYNTLCKAGTLNDWRYVRYSECKAWAPFDAGDQTNIRLTLSDEDVVYRFPFPDEDGDLNVIPKWDRVNQRDMFRTFRFTYQTTDEINHKEQVVHINPSGGGYGVNVWIPCLVRKGQPLKTSKNGAVPLCTIFGERYDKQGRSRTVFACAWCGALFSVDALQLPAIQQAILTYKPLEKQDDFHTWWDEVALRIRCNANC